MSISNIQKRKFLENLYRFLYSIGNSENDVVIRKPDEAEVKREFDSYFSINRIGSPLNIDLGLLRNTITTNPDLMNEMMARLLLNMEVLYDSIDDNNENIMKTITALNKRFNQLKTKRAALEAKVDDVLFAISNTDGYFYSFSDTFVDLNNVDLSLTNAFVDTENKKVTLPKLKSSVFDFLSTSNTDLARISYNLSFDGTSISQDALVPDLINIFDGLTNTSSTIEYAADAIGVCTLTMTIPLSSNFIVSKVDGRLTTSSPVAIVAELYDSSTLQGSQFRRKQTNSSYDRFSFDFNPQSVRRTKNNIGKI